MEERVNDPVSGVRPVSERQKILYRCLITAAAAGILAHGYMFFNKISWHDDLRHIFDVGTTYKSGRWALAFLASVMKGLFGMTVSLPAFNGFLSLLFIALSAYLVILRFRIRRAPEQVLVTALMACFPVVTATFSYVFTAPYYFFSLLCATAGAYLITECLEVWLCGRPGAGVPLRLTGGVFLLVFSMGIYQAYLASAVCFIVIFLFCRGLDEGTDTRRWILSCLAGAAASAAGVLFYIILNKLILRWKELEMGAYQGLNSMGSFGPAEILKGLGSCYYSFLKMFARGYKGIMYLLSTRLVLLALCMLTALEIVVLMRAKVKSPLQKALLIVMLLLSPVVLQLIELMTAGSGGGSAVHTLMVYSLVYLLLLPVILLQRVETLPRKELSRRVGKAVACCLAFFTVYFTFYSNAAYFKAWIYQEQAGQFYNRLIVRIESEEGYDPDMKVALVGTFDPDSYMHYPELDQIRITFYQEETLIANNYPGNRDLQAFFRLYDDFTPHVLTSDKSAAYAELPEVQEMSCYPADGSIRIIGDTVVVKLSDG